MTQPVTIFDSHDDDAEPEREKARARPRGPRDFSLPAIVLGAPVVHGRPLPPLAARLETAALLFHDGRASVLFVTGDDGRRRQDELTVMESELLALGVPAHAIVKDGAGTRTILSMKNARSSLGAVDVLVVTNPFHLPRALFLARQCGLRPTGVRAEERAVLGARRRLGRMVRELLAVVRAVVDVTV